MAAAPRASFARPRASSIQLAPGLRRVLDGRDLLVDRVQEFCIRLRSCPTYWSPCSYHWSWRQSVPEAFLICSSPE